MRDGSIIPYRVIRYVFIVTRQNYNKDWLYSIVLSNNSQICRFDDEDAIY